MRYVVLLEALGRSWEGAMRAKGVEPTTIESWGIYFNQLVMEAATCKPNKLHEIGHRLASSFKTALWYMEKAGGQ